jgi:lipopolysaccharide transport system permease protein
MDTRSAVAEAPGSQDPAPRPGSRAHDAAELPVIVIQPVSGWRRLQLGDVWDHRELVGYLTWRNIIVRYKQTALGAAWAVIQPVFTMIVFTIFFGHLAGLATRSTIPYPVLTYAALLPWQLFQYSITQAGLSLVGNQALVTKVYFPRLVLPLSVVFAGLVDFFIASFVLVGLMVYYGIVPGAAALLLPVFTLLAVIVAVGVGLWLAALSVEYRDVQYVIPFLLQFWLFVTPIAYPATIVPQRWHVLLDLNPMAGVVEGFRWALLGAPAPGAAFVLSASVAVVLLVTGLYYFRRLEDSFADVI